MKRTILSREKAKPIGFVEFEKNIWMIKFHLWRSDYHKEEMELVYKELVKFLKKLYYLLPAGDRAPVLLNSYKRKQFLKELEKENSCRKPTQ